MSDANPARGARPALPDLSVPEDITASLLQLRALEAPPRPGSLAALDRFEIIGVLGQGGMGVVLLGRDPAVEAKVAIKLLRPELAREPQLVRRFLTEARHMHRLNHQHILRVLEVCDRSASPYYVMPYMARGSLAARIRPGEPLDAGVALSVARDVAEALVYAHAQGIMHRDVKPMNVLLDPDDRAYLADFGLVRAFDQNESIVQPGHEGQIGTAAYMSPALVRNEAEDTRCDIYAFGAMLYEMLTGQPPYRGESREAILAQILNGPPEPIRVLNPKAPAGLAAVAEDCMARELRDRYASMNDVLADLRCVEQKQPPSGPRGQSRTGLRQPRAYLVIGIAVALAAGGWAAWHLRARESSPQQGPKIRLTGESKHQPATSGGSPRASATQAGDNDSDPRKLMATWPIAFANPLTDDTCLDRAYLSFPQTSSPAGPTFRVWPGEGLQIGWGTNNVAWMKCLVADEYVVSVEFLPFIAASDVEHRGTGIWLNGPGYGIEQRLGSRFWIAADGQAYALTVQGRAVQRASGRLEQPLDPTSWHRLDVLRRHDRFIIWLDGALLFDGRAAAPFDTYLHSYVGIGSGSGWYTGPSWREERAHDPKFRSFSIRMPEVQARRLAALPLERQLDGRAQPSPRANGTPLFAHSFGQEGLRGWFLPVDAEYVRTDGEEVMLTEWGRSPLLWYERPLRGDCAVELEARFLPELAPHAFFLCLGTEDPRAAHELGYPGWFVGVPAAWSANCIFWRRPRDHGGHIWSHAAHAGMIVSDEAYFIPVPGREVTLRLERTARHLRVFANGRFLMEADAPEPELPDELYFGVGKGFGPKAVRAVRAWRLNSTASEPAESSS